MARSLLDLANELDAMAFKLPQQVTSELAQQAAELVLARLLSETPVDTGQAISNWRISLNAPNHDILPAYYPGDKGSSQVICQQAAFEVGQAVLAIKQPGDTIYISNPLPYIQSLDEGSSTQNPGGFIDGAVLLARLFVENPSSFSPQGFV